MENESLGNAVLPSSFGEVIKAKRKKNKNPLGVEVLAHRAKCGLDLWTGEPLSERDKANAKPVAEKDDDLETYFDITNELLQLEWKKKGLV